MRSLVVSFILKRSYPYLYPFPAVWLRVFFLPVLSPQAFGVDSIVLGDNSKAYGDNSKAYGDNSKGYGDNSKGYGDNSKGYGDRIHPYKKV